MRQLVKLAMTIPLIALLVAACSQSPGVEESGASAPEKQVIYKSVVRAGGAIDVKTRVLGDVVVDRPVKVELEFGGDPGQALWIEIAESEHYRIEGDYRRYIEGHREHRDKDEDKVKGKIRTCIELVPLTAGKHYLRMTVSHAGEDDPRSVVVALPVKDRAGEMPETPKSVKDRIEFQSRPDK